MFPTLVRIAAVVSTGLFAGILFGDWTGTSPVRPTLPASCFVRFQQGLHLHFVPMMPILMVVAIVTGGVTAWLMRHSNRAAAACFSITALAIVAAFASTWLINVPINNLLMTWSVQDPPADWWQSWQPWERNHTFRTILSVAAFFLQVVGMNLLAGRTEGGSMQS